jgi:uncharacterized protein (TIGR02246 family)
MSWISAVALVVLTASAFAQTPSVPSTATEAPTATGRPSVADVIALEQSLWRAYAAGDADALDKLMRSDFTSVTRAISSRDEVLLKFRQDSQTCKVEPVAVDAPLVSILSDNVATIAYRAAVNRTCGEKTEKAQSNMTTVWVRRDGQWRMQLHSERLVSGFAVHGG